MGGEDFQWPCFSDDAIAKSGYWGTSPPKAAPVVAAAEEPTYNITLGIIDGSIVDLDTLDTIKTLWVLGEPVGGYAKCLELYYEIDKLDVREEIIKIKGQRKAKQIVIECKETITDTNITIVKFDEHKITFVLND